MADARVRLTGDEVTRRAGSLSGWQVLDQQRLAKTFRFPDFATALAFVNQAGEIAERQGHHPDLHLSWGSVGVEISTHDAGGLTELDFTLAHSIDQAFSSR